MSYDPQEISSKTVARPKFPFWNLPSYITRGRFLLAEVGLAVARKHAYALTTDLYNCWHMKLENSEMSAVLTICGVPDTFQFQHRFSSHAIGIRAEV